jgi:hypothetical protein
MTELIAIEPDNWAIWASMALVGTTMLGAAWMVAVMNEFQAALARREQKEITEDSVIECNQASTNGD